MRRFHQDVRRRIAHLGGCAAHDPGDADRAGAVGDQEVLDVELPLLVVEGGDLLPRHGAPHHNVAGQLVQVVAVRGLAEFQHDVVRDVHRQRDGADAGQPQARDHPRRRRLGGIDATDGAGHETVAPRLAVNGGVVIEFDSVPAGQFSRCLHL
ncbi:hypothetical protein D9M72_415320 [compost metagenome]